jgi:hypothetical protein
VSALTFGYDREWRGILDRPQEVLVGRVAWVGGITVERRTQPRVTTCAHCGGVRYDLGGAHAVRVTPAGRFDCRGQRA